MSGRTDKRLAVATVTIIKITTKNFVICLYYTAHSVAASDGSALAFGVSCISSPSPTECFEDNGTSLSSVPGGGGLSKSGSAGGT